MADESFSFEIVGSADKANKAADGVLNKLDAIGPRAARVSSELQAAFNKAEEIVRRYDAALASNSATQSKQAIGLAQAARAQAAYVEQLQREAQMLDRLHGPAQQAYQDIQTLNALLAKGAINAAEFNQALSKIRPPSNFTSGGAGGGGAASGLDFGGALGGLPGGSLLAGAIGGGAAGAANAGLQMAAGSVHEIIEMSDAYTGLNNRLVALTGSQSKATELFDKLHMSANKTRSDINTTTSSFVQFSRATRDLGVNQDQVLKFTEHLNEAIALSGADSNAAQAGLLQLSQAMSAGALRGQDLHSVMEQIPIVAQVIQDHLHVTAGKFKEMADNGQISAQVILDSFQQAGPKLEQQFGQAIPTIAQQFQVLKNDVSVAVGEMAKSLDLSGSVGQAIKNIKAAVDALDASTGALAQSLGFAGVKLADLKLGSGGLEGFRAIGNGITSVFDNADFSLEGFKRALSGAPAVQSQFIDAQQVINRTIAEGTGHLRDYDIDQIELALNLAMGADASTAFADATKTISEKAVAAHEATKAWADVVGDLTTGLDIASVELGKLGQAMADSPFVRSLGLGQKQAESLRQAHIELTALTEAHRLGIVVGKNYQNQYESLMTTLNNGQLPTTIKLWHQIHDPIEQHSQDVAALKSLHRSGAIDADQYARAMRKVEEAFLVLTDEGELLNKIHGPQKQALRDVATSTRLYDEAKISLLEYNDVLAQNYKLLGLSKPNAAPGQYALEAGGVGTVAGGQNQPFSQQFMDSLDKQNTGLTKMEDRAMTRLWHQQLEQIKQDNERYAQMIAKAWTPVENAIKEAATTGTISWSNFAKSMEQSLADIALQIIKTAALTALLGPGGRGGGALGFQGSLGTALFGALGGGANGFDYLGNGAGLQLPGFATGGDMVMRGGGATDSQLAMWWMTPGESLHVRTPEQRRQAADAASSDGGGTVIKPEFKLLMPRDDRAIVDDSRRGLRTLVKLKNQIDRDRR